MGAQRIDDRVFAKAGNSQHAAAGNKCDYRPGRGGWLAETGRQVWKEEAGGGSGGGDSNGAGRIPSSGMDGLRAAAQRAGPRGSGNAEHHGDVSAGAEGLGIRLDQSAARHDRSKEAGVCGSCEIHRRSTQTETASYDVAFERMGGAKSQVD